jgi:CHAT domain
VNILRFLVEVVEVDAGWQAVITCHAAGAAWRIERALRKVGQAGGRAFPFPPAAEMPASGDPDAAICDDRDPTKLDDMYQRIVNRQPLTAPVSDVAVFGAYLFRVLLGKAAWQAMLAAADQARAELVELALSWAADDGDLNRLNWEMMCGPASFLAAGRRDGGKLVPISIVRVIRGSSAAPRSLGLPPRVLYVVHSDIADESIRPAAEIVGLIERLERDGRGFHREVLRNASAQLVSTRVKAFRPDVVHFIGHGDVDGAGKGYLLLQDERHEHDEPAYAEQILGLLGAAGETPPIVVLSACKTGGGGDRALLGAHVAAPLAAALVAAGVPIVVGMAGCVSDRACRLFTLGFGAGLLSGKPLLAAIAAGRCAAFAEGPPPHKTADWAFPAVFLSAAVTSDYVATALAADDPSIRLAGRLRNLQLERRPVFCGRDDFFDAYNSLLGGEPRQVRPTLLGVHVARNEPGFGRTRLLQELAGQALRDGHLPLLLTYERPDGHEPHTCLDLALAVLAAADRACRTLQLPPIDVNRSPVRLLAKAAGSVAALVENAALDEWVKRELTTAGRITDYAVKLALQVDLAWLAAAFRDTCPPAAGRTARVLVLLNRVELFGEALTAALLGDWADASGLGPPAEPVPLVFSFAFGTAADHIFTDWMAKARSQPWIIESALKPFAPGEDMLAYQRVFMNPFVPLLLPGVSDVPLAVSDEADPKIVKIYERVFRVNGEGKPSAFLNEKTFAYAQAAIEDGYLVPMQDYKWFEDVFGRP